MAVADISLINSSVNSGNAVYLQGTSVNYGAKGMNQTSPVEGKYDISEVNVGGFGENPKITVEGVFDVDSTPSQTAISHALLLDFKQCKTKIKLTITSGKIGGKYLKGRPTAGYSIGGTYLDYLYVTLNSFNITFSSSESKEGHVWKYSATFTETT